MNPFSLSGPNFLIFYIVLCISVYLYAKIRVVHFEKTLPIPKIPLQDPYLIAYMRGGQREALTLATIILRNRSFIEEYDDGKKLKIRSIKDMNMVKYPIEKAVLEVFKRKTAPHEVFTRKSCIDACPEYKSYLEDKHLINNAFISSMRMSILIVPAAIVAFFALVKIIIALSQDRTNIGLLSLLFIAILYGLYTIYSQKKNQVFMRVFKDLSSLFYPLYQRRKAMDLNDHLYEHALLASVFGLTANNSFYNQAKYYFSSSRSKSGYRCGYSSCSSGSSCGGGCGGGCGGCGS